MSKAIYIFLIGILVSMSSCRKDFDTIPSPGNLEFSKQTVYLDTVFSDIGSSTYMLKVYNRSSKDITIPSVKLLRPDSKYRLMIDGLTGVDADNSGQGDGKIFPNVELLAKDSLFIFIETTANIADASPTDFLYTDEIQFESINGIQKVNLVTLIQDAIFLYPEIYANGTRETLYLGNNGQGESIDINGFELNENDPIHGDELHFTKDKPYVIYGYAGIPDTKTLIVDPGAKVYFHADSGLIAQPGGTLIINGTTSTNNQNPLENEVTFEGDRLEPSFEETPGQWGTVWLRQGSINNNINHLTLKNATVGLLVENAPLNINNSQIYNSSNVGILARTAIITSANLVINLAGQACLAAVGGSYEFTHCTFNNNWGSPKQVCVQLSNFEENPDQSISFSALNQANFRNSIIYGNNNVELFLNHSSDTSVPFTTDFRNCLVKFRDAGTGVEDDPFYYQLRNESDGNKKNEDPDFFNANRNKLNIAPESFAAAKGDPFYLSGNTFSDILGIPRTTPPDLGAYQSAAFPQ
ncbi:MAG: hypothetical protein H7199_12540 [Burkholderiales bacterium]|nr:hypothetical protein [Flavobacterium sp.]